MLRIPVNMHNVEPWKKYLDPRLGFFLEWTKKRWLQGMLRITEPSTKKIRRFNKSGRKKSLD